MGTFEATESTKDKTSETLIRSITSAYPPTVESTIGTDSQQNERTSGKTGSFSRFGTTEVLPSESRTTLDITHDKTNGLTNDRTFTTEAAATIEMGTFEVTVSTDDKTSDSPIRSITSAYPPTEESTIGTDSQQNERTSGKAESFSRFGTTEVHPSEGRTTLYITHDKTIGLTNDHTFTTEASPTIEMGTFEVTVSTDDKTSDSPIRSITSAYPPTEESKLVQTVSKMSELVTNGLTNDRTLTTEAAPTIEIGTFEATESTDDKTSDSPIRSITSAYPPTEESTIGTDSQQNEQTSGKPESFSRFGTTEVHPSESRTTLGITHDKTNSLTYDRTLTTEASPTIEMGTFEATVSTDDKTSNSPIRSITSVYPPTVESTIGTDSQQNEQTSGKTESFSRFGTTEVHPSESRTTLYITHDKTIGLTYDRTLTTEAAPTMEMGTFEATESTDDKTSNSPIRSITSAYPPTEESTIGTDSQQNEQTSGKTESFSRFGTTEVHPSESRTTLYITHDKTTV
ncbi:hypothetical protein BSL78_16813 [Apostichopus japonicus]|uniref:Uncharacterized protein n=1 Tax=Stichopus japonicus TaxID=307972 RepID=A0A2G8KED0_STIJA|nr:hypothetical protein BSL78_16813 [Apostichopus japonicus]